MKRFAQAANARARREAWLWRNRFSFGNVVRDERPRLLIDVSAIMRHDAQTGIQRVVRAVWSELAMHDEIAPVPIFATSTHGYCYAPYNFLERRSLSSPPKPVSVRAGDKFLGLDLSALWLPKYRRQIRAWRAHGATIHLVVYDLLPLTRPEWFTKAAVAHFRNWYDVLTKEADQAICISDEVAAELRRKAHDIVPRRNLAIARLRMGADIAASVPSTGLCDEAQRVLERLRFRPAILMVGTVEPRKGYDAALAAFDHLWRTRPNDAPELVIVGKPGWNTAKLQAVLRAHPELGRRLHWFDRMSDEGLCLIYEACRGVLMASRAEGFGLPLIEAAQHRRYVLARDLPVFREQRLSNTIFFADDRPESLGERILELAQLGQEGSAPLVDLPMWSDSVDGLLKQLGLAVKKEEVTPSLLREAS